MFYLYKKTEESEKKKNRRKGKKEEEETGEEEEEGERWEKEIRNFAIDCLNNKSLASDRLIPI